MGSANTSGLFKNLARRLGVKLLAHMPGNARATGQVEKARDIIERSFEPALRFAPVRDLDDLNANARRWAGWFNANKTHSRHGRTRNDVWLTITPEQLRLAPGIELCRELLTHEPESRKVSDTLTVQFRGAEYDVRAVPGVMVGEKLLLAINPYRPDAAYVVDRDENGDETLHVAPAVARDAVGFRHDANVIGEDWKRPPSTVLDANRSEVERFTYGASSTAEVDEKKRAKAVPFGGRIDPYKPIEQAPERTFIPRRGTALDLGARIAAAEPAVLTHFEAAKALVSRGVAMSPELVATLKTLHPDGVPETELDDLVARLTVRAGLRLVAGGGSTGAL
ncbi:hypothetical protein CLD22_24115 [Rubrivivax gelatinosus]|nr:hypothetical protein [Rubrivivax gelatinosus]